jgi:hypothetical protein
MTQLRINMIEITASMICDVLRLRSSAEYDRTGF